MRRITRHSQILLNAARAGSSEAREKLDKGDVELRETEYERERVREEIEKCMDYAPTYKDLPLPDTDTFLSNADPDILKNLPNPDDNSYPYALTTARLEQELADVIKLEGQLAQLTRDREAVIKAKKEIKSKFDAVDVYLTDFAKTTNAVASKIKDVAKVPLP
ncbi:hypothetical protein TREMEDRAFT_70597 [Tremella mesenterica DSM 1558]|uniref:uncharacterized protein n=1 Tax=Tremella mesenterica (strain ATCC 24925 / CBS 8224 / DSM 1558 / NBRC 9311 / NRRL Y-6157 / RJB 2259-6 / UBC 559-6) TaxID=578456 RepID=UPI0003F48E2F|nr:uncharacterized protein TREMEDRAFT_70597 [Tremella mesenterica DSM 1558]EIW71957.1 hypothetical protein TREMEDRAFT_70597 [Tremella mesenterica DSM 1558]